MLAFTLSFGYAAGREKLLPFFEMARLVYLSRYIQRIEAIFILLWVIFGVLAIAVNIYMMLYIVTRIFNMPSLRPLIPLAVFIMAQLAMLPPDAGTTVEINNLVMRTFKPTILYGIPLLLLAALFIRKKMGRKAICAEN